MKKNNILYIITKLELGGAQKHLLSVISHLDTNRYNIFLFTGSNGFLISEALLIPGIRINLSIFLERSISPIKDILALCEIFAYIKKNKINIVHTHSSKSGIIGRIAAKLAGVKVIVHTVHGWSFNDYQPYLLRLFYIWLERICANCCSKIITVSNYDKEKGLKNSIGELNQYIVITYGIDLKQFSEACSLAKNKPSIYVDNLVVGMIACFKPQKNPEAYIKLAGLIIKDFPQVKFLLIGDGVLRKNIERLIEKLRIKNNCILLGWRQDIAQLLLGIDIFVLTSLWEGLPISVLEAMACAKPVLATNTGGVSELILDGKTGFLVECGNIRQMTERLKILLNDNDLRLRIGQSARDSLGERFSIDCMIKNIDNLYGSLTKINGIYAN